MERIGEILRGIRKDKKLTQKEVALQANISNSYLCDIESKRSNPSIKTLVSLCKVLEIKDFSVFFDKNYVKVG